jgi:hypothetical protein
MCHYDSRGGGPLTDYGRALYSQEIAARNFWTPSSVSDEEVAGRSGFIPGKELPYWIRPSLEYRGLWVQTNPGGSNSKTISMNMERDVNLVFAFDPKQRTVLVLNYGLLPYANTDYYANGHPISGVSREHYLRFFLSKEVLISAGLMDIAYGLRIDDHTAYSRGSLGLGENDQVHGVLVHWLGQNWDVSAQGFVGNLFAPSNTRRKGGAVEFEYAAAERDRVGSSITYWTTATGTAGRFGVHNRWGLPNAQGSSLIAEVGLKQDKTDGSSATLGSYGLIQALVNLVRGYNFLTTIERDQDQSKFSSPENQRWTFGFLMYPLQRTEVRLTAVQDKTFAPSDASPDQWQLQGQVHVTW